MHAIPLITGFTLGVLFSLICHAFYYLRKNPLKLPERNGFVIVTRKDGSQHYRRRCTAVENTDMFSRVWNNPIPQKRDDVETITDAEQPAV